MSRWTARARQHRVRRSAQELSALVRGVVATGDRAENDSLTRLRVVCERLDTLLRNADPQWLTPGALDAWDAAVKAVSAALVAWRDQPGQESLARLDAAVDALVDIPLGWQLSAPDLEVLARLRATGEDATAEFLGFLDDQRAVVERAANRATSESEQAGRDHLARLAALVEQAEESRRQLELYQSQAAQLVGVVAVTGLAGGFKQYAERQCAVADRWRLVSVGCAGLAAVIALAFALAVDQPLTWNSVISKAIVIALLGAIAAYAGRESAAHRQREITARHLELELTAIDPYLASLDDGRRAAVKEQMALRIFGHPATAPLNPEPAPALTPELRERLQALAGTLENILKR